MIYFDLGSAEDLARALVWVATHPLETFEITKRGQGVYKEHAWSREREKLLDLGAGLLRKGEKGI
jgi:hypothetical protein